MLELEVVPERSLGNEQWELVLGMAFSQTVHILQQHFQTIKGVQVLYSELNPLSMDLIINLSLDGIRLIFDSISQRLKIIEVYGMNKVKLKYCGLPFCSPEVPPTIEQIDHSFGATHPGVYDAAQQVFVLNFRGLCFSFPVDSLPQQQNSQGLGSLQFPNGASPIVSKMCIYSGNNINETRPPPLPLSSFYNHCYLDKMDVLREKGRTKGIRLHLITEVLGPSKMVELKKQIITRELYFGDSAQRVCGLIGSPSKVFYKAEDKMKIHSPNAHKLVTAPSSDYFYNYFTLGMDILMDSRTHTIQKFILHTNYPGHFNFNMYYRCNFTITLRPSARDKCLLLPSSKRGGNTNILLGSSTETASSEDQEVITAFTKWDTVQDRLISSSERPVVLNRTASINTTNPFGPTFSFGFEDIIFEVMPNNHIASVTLYNQTKRIPPPLDAI